MIKSLSDKSSKTNRFSKIFGFMISLIVLGLLVLSGPAQGFNMSLDVEDSNVEEGENIVFNVDIDINSFNGKSELLDVEYLVLEIKSNDANKEIYCKFNVNGSKIEGCDDLSIEVIDNESYSYDYGYGYGYEEEDYLYGYGYEHNFGYGYGYKGNLKYKIIFNTENYKGNYSSNLIMKVKNKEFNIHGDSITIDSEDNDDSDDSSSGGGSSSGRCYTDWECGEWSNCINSKQTRICNKINPYCYSNENPVESKNCSQEEGNNEINEDNTEGNSNESNNEGINTENQNSETRAGITGNVIGFGKENPGILILIFGIAVLLGLVIGNLLVRSSRKKRRLKEFNRIR